MLNQHCTSYSYTLLQYSIQCKEICITAITISETVVYHYMLLECPECGWGTHALETLTSNNTANRVIFAHVYSGGEKYFPDFTVSFDLATFELNSVLKCLYWVTENPDITEEWAVILRGSVSVVHSVFQRTHMAVFLESKCHRWCQQIHAAGQYCIFYHFIFWRKHISVTMVYQHITTVSKRFSECSLSC